MSLKDIINVVETNGTFKLEDFKGTLCTDEQWKAFKSLMLVTEDNSSRFANTEDASQFFDWCPIFKSLDHDSLEDAFYCEKVGYRLEGVPAKLVFILTKALKLYPPNKALSLVDKRVFQKYSDGKNLKEGVCIRKVLSTICKYDVKLLCKDMPIVKNDNVFEVYMEEHDAVLVMPEKIGEKLYRNPDQVKLLNVDKTKGVMLLDVPLSTVLAGRAYIDIFDLRHVL